MTRAILALCLLTLTSCALEADDPDEEPDASLAEFLGPYSAGDVRRPPPPYRMAGEPDAGEL